ncbi:hypothetical protein NDU88_003990 [Pleurodeles waltl]|uniref:Uncharacterized protein n=1 Tax=Pleurodeles waltl TaxID=8319 RepID=A0AAV7TSP6_PLEWA|nr:hypothetical protein NDU88_003990 [Pleurodeles waltl]
MRASKEAMSPAEPPRKPAKSSKDTPQGPDCTAGPPRPHPQARQRDLSMQGLQGRRQAATDGFPRSGAPGPTIRTSKAAFSSAQGRASKRPVAWAAKQINILSAVVGFMVKSPGASQPSDHVGRQSGHVPQILQLTG